MFRMDGMIINVKEIVTRTYHNSQGDIFPVVRVKIEALPETREELAGVLPGYTAAIESILDEAIDWQSREHVALSIALDDQEEQWTFHMEEKEDEDELEVSVRGVVVGTPKLKIQPDKVSTLAFVLKATVNHDTQAQFVRLLSNKNVRLYRSSAQGDLLELLDRDGVTMTFSTGSYQ